MTEDFLMSKIPQTIQIYLQQWPAAVSLAGKAVAGTGIVDCCPGTLGWPFEGT